ncbi:MAG: U32 family peptidase [Clostridia bacterium]|nr:U32 family peptidase [Clostridia bacterium]
MRKIELLSPAGDMSKLKTAFYYGADAVYVGGKELSLRALAGNFTNEQIVQATDYAHKLGKKLYVTVNVLARDNDFALAEEYFKFLEKTGVDGAIVSDAGLIYLARQVAPNLSINVSTQANVLNSMTVKFWQQQGVKRVILARELSLSEINRIHQACSDMELETFIHGAMCISYSGRCLLSDYRTGRSSNRGECVQACRWNYEIREKGSDGEFMSIEQDDRGTYILNSKDLNLLDYISQLDKAGVCSFKIEGRMKSEYYLATVVNAYRRAIDAYYLQGDEYKNNPLFQTELKKTAHREFTTAYLLGENDRTVNYDDSQSKGTHKFIANVIDYDNDNGIATVEMRNRFVTGDELEVLSPSDSFNQRIIVPIMYDSKGNEVTDAKLVQQILTFKTQIPLSKGDILRKKV